MRIISQDGKTNLSLDLVHLSTAFKINNWAIVARDGIWERPMELAVYSSKEKCMGVFQTIITACYKGFSIIELPEDDEVIL